jgi:hypothetical protein
MSYTGVPKAFIPKEDDLKGKTEKMPHITSDFSVEDLCRIFNLYFRKLIKIIAK